MKELGVELPIIFAQMVNFGLLLFVLNFLLYKPFLSMMKKRKEEESSLSTARAEFELEKQAFEEKSEKMNREWKERTKNAEREVAHSVSEARREVLLKAQRRAEEIVKKAKTASNS